MLHLSWYPFARAVLHMVLEGDKWRALRARHGSFHMMSAALLRSPSLPVRLVERCHLVGTSLLAGAAALPVRLAEWCDSSARLCLPARLLVPRRNFEFPGPQTTPCSDALASPCPCLRVPKWASEAGPTTALTTTTHGLTRTSFMRRIHAIPPNDGLLDTAVCWTLPLTAL